MYPSQEAYAEQETQRTLTMADLCSDQVSTPEEERNVAPH